MSVQHNFEVNTELTGMVLGYKTPRFKLIADEIIPKTPVTAESFKWYEFPLNTFVDVPDTLTGETGDPSTSAIEAIVHTDSIEYHTNMVSLPIARAKADNAGLKLEVKSAEKAIETLILAREKRVAKLMQNPKNFGFIKELTEGEFANNKASKIFETIQTFISSMLYQPNCAIMTKDILNALRVHPDAVSSYKEHVGGDVRGEVSADCIKEMLGVEHLFIGDVKINSAKAGKPPVLQNIWNDNIVFFYQAKGAGINQTDVTFALTAEFETRQIQTFDDPKPGANGIRYYKGVEKLKELVVSKNCGGIIQNVLGQA